MEEYFLKKRFEVISQIKENRELWKSIQLNLFCLAVHDIILQGLLEHNFKMFYFREQVENGKYFLYYKIKVGFC